MVPIVRHNPRGREGRTYSDLISEDLRRRPVEQCLVLVNAVDHDRTAAADVVDAVLGNLLDTGGLNDNVEAVRVVLLQLLPLRFRVLPVKLDVLVRSVELFCDVHLDTLVRGKNHTVCTIQLEELSKDETGRAGSEHEDVNANWRVELVETVNCACCRLK